MKELACENTFLHHLLEANHVEALAIESSDSLMQEELVPELDTLAALIKRYRVARWLSEPTDANSADISIHAGSGGTEACDWAAMLSRMYSKWAHSRDYSGSFCTLFQGPFVDPRRISVEVVEESPGDVAGIKSTTLFVNGLYAYGYAQYETGVHRLVRISPFDQARARHTSFASVRVSPHFEEDSEITGMELNPGDLRITTMRSQGAGAKLILRYPS